MSFLKYALLNPSFNISYVLYIVLALNKFHTISISAPFTFNLWIYSDTLFC